METLLKNKAKCLNCDVELESFIDRNKSFCK